MTGDKKQERFLKQRNQETLGMLVHRVLSATFFPPSIILITMGPGFPFYD
jgi:hypothetical protein